MYYQEILKDPSISIESWIYADAYLRYPKLAKRAEPTAKVKYRKDKGLWVPLSCAFSVVGYGYFNPVPYDGNTYTTDPFNPGSPDLFLVWMGKQGGVTNPVVTDNKGNGTYNYIDPSGSIIVAGYKYIGLAYISGAGLTGGSGFTLTLTGSSIFASLVWLSLTGGRTSSDAYTGNEIDHGFDGPGSAGTISTGSIASTTGNLLTTGLFPFTDSANTSSSINSGFTWLNANNYVSGDAYPVAQAYKISTGSNENPQWTLGTSEPFIQTMIAEFAAAGGGSPSKPSSLTLVGTN